MTPTNLYKSSDRTLLEAVEPMFKVTVVRNPITKLLSRQVIKTRLRGNLLLSFDKILIYGVAQK